MQELGKQGIIIVLTDANLVANPTLDRPNAVPRTHNNIKEDNLALTLQQDLNYRDTYRECQPEGHLTTHTSAHWQTSARLDQIWLKHIHQNESQGPCKISILAAGVIHTGSMLKSDHIPIAAMIPGTQLITHSPDPDLDEVEIDKIQAQNPKPLPKDLTNPPDKIRLLLANKRSMENIEAHRLNMVI